MNSADVGCDKECKFSYGASVSTAAHYPPIYNELGVNTNPDMNTISGSAKCSVCNKSWTYVIQNGATTFTEIN